MFKEYFLRKMFEQKLRHMPEADRERLLELIFKNPELFKKIGEEIQGLIRSGKSEADAAQEVFLVYQDELRKLGE